MFIPLTNTGGKQVYVNMALVVWVAPYDGASEGGPYGPCRSLLLYGSGEALHVRETPEQIMDLEQGRRADGKL